MKEADTCLACGSREIVRGKLETGGIVLWSMAELFFIGEIRTIKKLYKISDNDLKIDASSSACCFSCGLVWTKPRDSTNYFFKEKAGKTEKIGTKCANCGSERLVIGEIINNHRVESEISFNPGAKNIFFYYKHPVFVNSSKCCLDCWHVFSRVDPDALVRFVLANCEPNLAKNILSYAE